MIARRLLPLLALTALLGGCERFDGFTFGVENDPGFSEYLVTRGQIEMPVGAALLIEIRPTGNDDPADLRLRSRDEAVLRVQEGPGSRLVFVGSATGETVLEVLYRGQIEDRIPVTIFDQP